MFIHRFFFNGIFVVFEKLYTFALAIGEVDDLDFIVQWCNGSTTDSGPVSPGSSPG